MARALRDAGFKNVDVNLGTIVLDDGVCYQVDDDLARITGLSDRLDVAEAAAEAVLASPEGATPRFAMDARASLGLVAVVRGDGTAAEELYNTLMSSSDRLLGVLIPQ